MAKNNPGEYNNRKIKFSTALDAIICYDALNNGDRKYCDRLRSYFIALANNSSTQEEMLDYLKCAKKLEKSAITNAEIAKVFDVEISTVNRWRKGTLPPLTVPVKLAEIFGVTTDFLLGVDGTADRETEAVYNSFEKYGISFLHKFS